MSRLDHYLKVGEASVAGYTLSPGGRYRLAGDWPSADLLWDADGRVFAWWWAYDDRPHAFRIERVEEEGDTVTLFHARGKIELTPILLSPRARRSFERWKRQDQDFIRRSLEAYAAQVREEPALPSESAIGRSRTFQIMIELVPDTGEPGRWVPVGAWAADEQEIAYWSFPEYEPDARYLRDVIARARAERTGPLEIFRFWFEQANGQTVMRVSAPPVEAPDARTAAERAAYRAREEWR